MPKNYSEDASRDVVLKVPGLTIGTLISMLAVAKRVACDGKPAADRGLRRAAQFMEQLIYEQTYEGAGADEVWRDPKDGSYHHPTFPEQDGEAWAAVERYDEQIFAMRLVETASHLLATRDRDALLSFAERLDHYEHLLLDIMEAEGPEGVLKYMVS